MNKCGWLKPSLWKPVKVRAVLRGTDYDIAFFDKLYRERIFQKYLPKLLNRV
ncbi:hypothetical protein PARA125_001935 [Parachlamydia sp. AcF125]|nr:hypothetical protein [Parachlamydia sp. AcF125]